MLKKSLLRSQKERLTYPLTKNDIKDCIFKSHKYEFYRHPLIQKEYEEWIINNNEDQFRNNNNKTLVIKKNNFPYYLEVPYKHYVAWYYGKWNDSRFYLHKERLQQKYKKAFIFINPQQTRSIKTIPHFHIISRTKVTCTV